MKVLVTGAAGLLGSDICRAFEREHEILALGRTAPAFLAADQFRECDLADARRVYSVVTRDNPDMIVNCAAYNNVDGAETAPEEAYRGNAIVARNLVLAAQRFDAAVLHISTDYVFDGENPPVEGYREFDSCRPLNKYGESKWWAEETVRTLVQKHFIVRTSWLFGPGRPTWVDHVVAAARKGERVLTIKDMRSAPTYTPDLATGLLRLAESGLYGTYHLTNAGFCNRVELAERVLRLNGMPTSPLRIMEQAEAHLAARRPVFSGLQNLTWKLNGFPMLRNWQDALQDHFAKVKVT